MMSRLPCGALALTLAAPAMGMADPARYMPAELIAESAAPRPGTTILIGFQMTPRAGWHGYWINPGDSGISPTVSWKAPPGVRFGPLLHPAPTLLTAGGISSFVHEGPHILLSRMTIPASFAPGTPVPVEAKLSWAACTATQCVPLHATLKIGLTAGAGRRSADAAELDAAARKLPRAAPPGTFVADGKTVRLLIPASVRLDPRAARFFPDDNDAFATAAARSVADNGQIAITSAQKGDLPTKITGVVSDGSSSYRIELKREAASPGTSLSPKAVHAQANDTSRELPAAAPSSQIATTDALQPTGAIRAEDRAPGEEPHWRWYAFAAVLIFGAALIAFRHLRR